MFSSIGQIGGPLLGGAIVSVFGFGAVFLTAAGLSMLSMIAALVLLPKLPRSVEARPAQASMARRAREYLKMRETQFLILTSCLMGIPEILRTSLASATRW